MGDDSLVYNCEDEKSSNFASITVKYSDLTDLICSATLCTSSGSMFWVIVTECWNFSDLETSIFCPYERTKN